MDRGVRRAGAADGEKKQNKKTKQKNPDKDKYKNLIEERIIHSVRHQTMICYSERRVALKIALHYMVRGLGIGSSFG